MFNSLLRTCCIARVLFIYLYLIDPFVRFCLTKWSSVHLWSLLYLLGTTCGWERSLSLETSIRKMLFQRSFMVIYQSNSVKTFTICTYIYIFILLGIFAGFRFWVPVSILNFWYGSLSLTLLSFCILAFYISDLMKVEILQGSTASSSCSFHVNGFCVLELLLVFNFEQLVTQIFIFSLTDWW